jgi:Nidogen-like/Metallo-peptidase family M12
VWHDDWISKIGVLPARGQPLVWAASVRHSEIEHRYVSIDMISPTTAGRFVKIRHPTGFGLVISLAVGGFSAVSMAPEAGAQATVGAIRSNTNCSTNTLAGNDDGSTGAVSLGFSLRFFGNDYSSVYVNNNGNVTFGAPLPTYSPTALAGSGLRMIAPFWADVDTRNAASGKVKYGQTVVNGRRAFCVNWSDVAGVGYFNNRVDKLNRFQLVLVDSSDEDADFNVEFNYDKIQWETGDASGGSGGLGGTSARAGFSNGTAASSFELPGSGIAGAFLDSNPTTGLAKVAGRGQPPVIGRHQFAVVGGSPRTDTPAGYQELTVSLSSIFGCENEVASTALGLQFTNYVHAGTTCDGVTAPSSYKVEIAADTAISSTTIASADREPIFGDLNIPGAPSGSIGFQTVTLNAPYFAANPQVIDLTIRVFAVTSGVNTNRSVDVNPDPAKTSAALKYNRTTGDWTVNGLAGHRNFVRGDGNGFAPAILTFDVTSAATSDTDNDGLLNGWEQFGIVTQDISSLPTLAASPLTGPELLYRQQLPSWDAKVDRKDLFVELDRVAGTSLLSGRASTGNQGIDNIVEAFKAKDIHASFDTGALTTDPATPTPIYGENLRGLTADDVAGQTNVVPNPTCSIGVPYFQSKLIGFNPNRRWVFHYAIAGTCAGLAEVNGNDIVVDGVDAGTIMHELGHNLGLNHSGNVSSPNCSPNYVSVMNYSYQRGINVTGGKTGTQIIDFSPPRTVTVTPKLNGTFSKLSLAPSTFDSTILNETSISEGFGLKPSRPDLQVHWWDSHAGTGSSRIAAGNTAVDVNGVGGSAENGLTANVDLTNAYGGAPSQCGPASKNNEFKSLDDHNDWAAINLKFRDFGSAAYQSAGEVSDDLGMLTAEQYRQIELDAFRTDYQISGAAVYIPTENAYDVTISVKNNGPIGTTNPAVGITLGTGVPQPNLDGCINEPNIIECNLGSYLETGETITRTFRTPAPPSGTGTITFTATGNTNITDGTDTNPTNNTTTITLNRCVVCVLAPNGNAIGVQGRSASIDVKGDVAVASTAPDAVTVVLGRLSSTRSIQVAGGTQNQLGTITPAPVPGGPVNNPLASYGAPNVPTDAPVSCVINGNNATCGNVPITQAADGTFTIPNQPNLALTVNGNAKVNIGPGRYDTLTVSGSASVTMRPGNFFIGGAIINGSARLEGTQVTLFSVCSSAACSTKLVVNGNAKLATTSTGIALAAPIGHVAIEGSGTINLGGDVYIPQGALSVTGNLTTTMNRIIASTIKTTNGAVTVG